jgi:hypothetical protein
VYYGITAQKAASRAGQHARDGKLFDMIKVISEHATRAVAKAKEAKLIEKARKRGKKILNKIR